MEEQNLFALDQMFFPGEDYGQLEKLIHFSLQVALGPTILGIAIVQYQLFLRVKSFQDSPVGLYSHLPALVLLSITFDILWFWES